jgi:hypothetical protein
MLRQNKNVLRHEVSFGKYSFISLVTRRDLSLRNMDIFLYEAWILFFTKHKKREGVFSPKAQKRYVCKFHASQRNKLQYFTYSIQSYTHQILQSCYSRSIMSILVSHTSTISKCFYNKVYSSLRTFSVTSFKSLPTTSSIMESAIFIMSNASFISGSAKGSYGSGGGDSSAEVGKIN